MNAVLNVFALLAIFFLIIAFAAVIVVLGSLPGKIALKRGHPHPDAVNVASWIGIFTGVFWPLVFIWAFLPVPGRSGVEPADLAEMRQRLEALEAAAKNAGEAS